MLHLRLADRKPTVASRGPVALAVPTFTPYIEICHLDRFNSKSLRSMLMKFPK
jgi:hypothetical protein